MVRVKDAVAFLAVMLLFAACDDGGGNKNDVEPVSDDGAAVSDDATVGDADTAVSDELVTDEPVSDEPASDADDPFADLNTFPAYEGTYGWEILKSTYEIDPQWDALSFEWDYFMIHNEDDSFSGSVGYLIANPRNAQIAGGAFGKLVPGGGNIAIAGRFNHGEPPIADYENFDPDNGHTFEASGEERSFWVENTEKGYWGRMTPDPVTNTVLLEGKTGHFEWELTVRQDWTILTSGDDTFVKVTDDKVDTQVMGFPVSQVGNVHMFWPRTKITGWIKDLLADKTIAIDAHGYRENSWGRWAFNQGGWDFGTCSDAATKVMFGWQSYHFNSTRLDYLDMGFYDGDEYKLVNFRADAGELGWKHDTWKFDPVARQCTPHDTTLVAQNDTYRVEAQITIGNGQVPMLSEATEVVKKYVIVIQIPWFEGVIKRVADGSVVTTFQGRGGGEFSTERADEGTTSMTDEECATWGAKFSSPMPE